MYCTICLPTYIPAYIHEQVELNQDLVLTPFVAPLDPNQPVTKEAQDRDPPKRRLFSSPPPTLFSLFGSSRSLPLTVFPRCALSLSLDSCLFLFFSSFPFFFNTIIVNLDVSSARTQTTNMSRRPGASGNPLPAAGRQNEYFVPRDGIDREVITADICRYLGNDALVRPGTYEVRFPFLSGSSFSIGRFSSLTFSLLHRTLRVAN